MAAVFAVGAEPGAGFVNDLIETGRHENPIHDFGLNKRLFRSSGELPRFWNSENVETNAERLRGSRGRDNPR